MTRSEIIGHNDDELNPDKSSPLFLKYLQTDMEALTKGYSFFRHESYVNRERKVLQTSKYLLTLEDNKRMLIGLSQDVTELDNRNKDLEQAKEAMLGLDKLKTAFLANISHEIRTPLNSIMGFSQMLREAETEEEKEHFAQIITKNGKALTGIIDDILMLSQMEAGYLTPNVESFNLSDLLRKLYTFYESKTPDGVVLRLSIPEEPLIISQGLVNLNQIIHKFIKNAITYTKKGEIKIGYRAEDGGAYIFVEDTGIGIDKDKMSKVFKKFEKINDYNSGIGIGLYICKLLSQQIGGRINVHSEKGVGSKFCVWVPKTLQN